MRLVTVLAGMLLLQAGVPATLPGFSAAGPGELQSLRYLRTIHLPEEFPANSTGSKSWACAVLDTAALAHSASRSGDDLRVFAQRRGAGEADRAPWVETPFLLTESAAAPGDAEPATVENVHARDGTLAFDLAMPQRAYTTVDLHLAAQDFVGTARVFGLPAPGSGKVEGSPVAVGTFVIFDLSGEHLARSTSLPLQELQFPVLHVDLSLKTPQGRPLPGLSTATVQGADVPPSREAQTLYTTVESTDALHQQGPWSVTRVHVPAHVPIARVSFELDPHFTRSFRRAVTVLAQVDGALPSNAFAAEAVDGEIWRVTRPNGNAGQPPLGQARLSMDAVLASNLRAPAVITIAVKNGAEPALPLRAIQLEMRQRKICFPAVPGELYTLRYGDSGLAAPDYGPSAGAGLSVPGQPSAQPIGAQLGPEWLNPNYVARPPVRPFSERHPELLWMGLLVSTTVLGVLGGQSLKRQD